MFIKWFIPVLRDKISQRIKYFTRDDSKEDFYLKAWRVL